MFSAMGQGFRQRQFEFQNEVRYMVTTFLAQFDVIFTLNQDTLLELHYLGKVVGGKWNASRIPGIKSLGYGAHLTLEDEKIGPQQPDPEFFKLQPRIQPYIKLHGSCNWTTETGGPHFNNGRAKSGQH